MRARYRLLFATQIAGLTVLVAGLLPAWGTYDGYSALSSDARGIQFDGLHAMLFALVTPLGCLVTCGILLLALALGIAGLAILGSLSRALWALARDGLLIGILLLAVWTWYNVREAYSSGATVDVFINQVQYTVLYPWFWLVPGCILTAGLSGLVPHALLLAAEWFGHPADQG